MERISSKKAVVWTLGTIFAPLCVISLLSSAYIAHWYATTGFQGPAPPEVIMQGFMIMTAPGLWITVGIWWLIHRRRTDFGELFAARTNSVGTDLLVGAAVGLVWAGFYGLSGTVPFSDMFSLDLAKLQSVPTSVSAGFCEEFLFRGFVFLLIARAGGGAGAQLAYSSVAFGLAHCWWGPWGMLWTLVLGLTLGLVRLWRGNVWPAVVGHTILNLCIEPALVDRAITGSFR